MNNNPRRYLDDKTRCYGNPVVSEHESSEVLALRVEFKADGSVHTDVHEGTGVLVQPSVRGLCK